MRCRGFLPRVSSPGGDPDSRLASSLGLDQVLFVLLAFNLLRIFLRAQDREPLTRRSRPRTRGRLLPSDAVILIYREGRYATLSPTAHTELLLTLPEEARTKILETIRRLRRELREDLPQPRAP